MKTPTSRFKTAVYDQIARIGKATANPGRLELLDLPATPPNFARIVELNEAGELPEGDPTDLEAGANRCAVS